VDNQEYRLGPGDKLRIEVYKDLQLSQSVQVRPDGKITMPLIGDVMASGLAPTELRDQLTAALREYVNNPVVTVIVVEAVASVVFVMGEVSKPGTLSMAGPMTVLQALAMAGGFSTFAKTTDIRIIRRGARGTETIRFNYREAIKDGAVPVFLKRGDLVVVR
jgi:polysaccharide export outer membrane protein